MSNVAAIQGWMSEVAQTFSGLGAAVEQVAPSGDFAQVFSQAQTLLSDEPGASGAATTSASAPAAPATASTPTSALLSGSASAATSTTTGATVVATAEKYLGVPYVWGGTTPSGFDCSGFTQYVYGQLGIALPRTSEEQALVGTPVASVADAQPGDLVFYAGSDGTAASPGHVGIYLGNGEMIDAPETGSNVSITAVGDPTAIRRILTPSATTALSAGTTLLTDPAASSLPSAQVTPVTAAATTATSTSSSTSTATAPGASISTATTTPAATTDATGGTATTDPSGVAVPTAYAPMFTAAAATYGVPDTLLAAMAQVESGFDPSAVSSAGAEGLMQLMPSVASGLGVNAYDPAQAIDGAAQLMSGYLAQYHSTAMALAAYNAGPNAVASYGGVPPYPETQAYVQNVMQIAGIAS